MSPQNREDLPRIAEREETVSALDCSILSMAVQGNSDSPLQYIYPVHHLQSTTDLQASEPMLEHG